MEKERSAYCKWKEEGRRRKEGWNEGFTRVKGKGGEIRESALKEEENERVFIYRRRMKKEAMKFEICLWMDGGGGGGEREAGRKSRKGGFCIHNSNL